MAWLDFLRGRRDETSELPLFPLNTVLFPGGVLGLKVFEARYLDMAARCLRERAPFGICLAQSEENGLTEPHEVGTLAEIVNADMAQAGVLMLTVRGGGRFRIEHAERGAEGLLTARVAWLAEPPSLDVPAARQRLLPVLKRIVGDLGVEKVPEPHRWDDAAWVGYRLAEAMPVQNLAKQKLLELENPLARLEILEKFLEQKRLLA